MEKVEPLIGESLHGCLLGAMARPHLAAGRPSFLKHLRSKIRDLTGSMIPTMATPFVILSFTMTQEGQSPIQSEDAEDVRLMNLVGRGDTNAFEQLIERHQALVMGTIARMLGSNSDVEDIAQQVFIRVWRSAPRYKHRAKFTTWLLKITRNLVFNELRRTRRHPHVPFQPSDAAAEEWHIKDDVIPGPDTSLLENEFRRAVESAIMLLPETQRMALVLRRYEELSYEEIADVLDVTVPAIKSLLFRARTELRTRLSKYLSG